LNPKCRAIRGGMCLRDESPNVRLLGVGPQGRACRRAGGARRTRGTRAEAHRAVGANAVRELHAPAAPRCDAFHEGIAVVARVPRAAADQHRNLPTFVMRTQSATAMPRLIRPGTTRICRAQRRSSRGKCLASLAEAGRKKFFHTPGHAARAPA